MLRNRVDPFGNIIETPARGLFMGNRGVIHNEDKQITRVFRHKAWITCLLAFKSRQRTVMSPGAWTELFFLDEATAFAAGHRPCFECRREAALRFKSCWIKGNPSYPFTMKTSIKEIDEVIHLDRMDSDLRKVTHQRLSSDIAEGAFVSIDDLPYVLSNNRLYRWTPFGYEGSIATPESSMLTVLTPKSIENAFRAGYVPQIKHD